MSQSLSQYGRPAKILHWLMAILVLAMIPAGMIMIRPDVDRSLQNTLFLFHKNMGVLLFGLVVLRALYRWWNPPAPLPEAMPAWQRKAAALSHGLLYILLFVLPIAGYIRVKAGGFPIEMLDRLGVPSLVPKSDQLAELAKTVHHYGGYAIAGLVVIHIAAAIYHALIRRDGVFARMWPPFAAK